MYVHKDAMPCIPQDPLSIKMRIITLILSYAGLISVLVSYIYPSWSTFNHNGQTGSLGIHKMCADESDGSWDCRDVSDKGKLKFAGTVIYILFVWEIIFLNDGSFLNIIELFIMLLFKLLDRIPGINEIHV